MRIAHIKNRATLGAAFFNVKITTLYVLKKPRYLNTPNQTSKFPVPRNMLHIFQWSLPNCFRSICSFIAEPIIIKRSFTIIMTYHKFKNSNLPSRLNDLPYAFLKKFIVSNFNNCALYIALEHNTRDTVQIKITSKFNNVLSADSIRLSVI